MRPTYRFVVVVCGVIESGVVHHGGDHQVDVDPQAVVEHEPEESQESEDISDRNTVQAAWSLHLIILLNTMYLCTD